jgi:hypothetical protein
MRVARSHPLLGWLRLDGHTYSRTLDRSLIERDRALLIDGSHTGHAAGFIDWVWTTQLSELLRKADCDCLPGVNPSLRPASLLTTVLWTIRTTQMRKSSR